MKIEVLRDIRQKLPLWTDENAREIPFFSTEVIRYRSYIAAWEGSKLVGLVGMTEDSMRIPGAIGVSFVSTSPNHRNAGVARRLVEALFKFAKEQGKGIANTRYEPDGEQWLRHVFSRLAQQLPEVPLYEVA